MHEQVDERDLANYIPQSDAELHDGRISLEFQAYASGREELGKSLAEGDSQLLGWLSMLVAQSCGASKAQSASRARGVFATAEGLGAMVTRGALSPDEAMATLDEQLHLNGFGRQSARPGYTCTTRAHLHDRFGEYIVRPFPGRAGVLSQRSMPT